MESQLAAIESGSDVDDELAALKAQMSLESATHQSSDSKPNQVTDSELEQLKKQLDQL